MFSHSYGPVRCGGKSWEKRCIVQSIIKGWMVKVEFATFE